MSSYRKRFLRLKYEYKKVARSFLFVRWALKNSTINNETLSLPIPKCGTIDLQLTDGVNPVTPDAVSVVGNTVTVEVAAGGGATLSAFPIQTGQTTSYFTGDDGGLQLGSLVSFLELKGTGADWHFGHTRRFTGITGGYHNGTNYVDVNGTTTTKALAFPETIVLDWATWDRSTGQLCGWQYNPTLFTNTTRATAVTNCTGFSTTSYSTGWFMNNIHFLTLLYHEGVTPPMGYAPFEDITAGVSLWSSTTRLADTTQGRIMRADTKVNNAAIGTASARAFPSRIFNISEL
jgi:hypothetical protein